MKISIKKNKGDYFSTIIITLIICALLTALAQAIASIATPKIILGAVFSAIAAVMIFAPMGKTLETCDGVEMNDGAAISLIAASAFFISIPVLYGIDRLIFNIL